MVVTGTLLPDPIENGEKEAILAAMARKTLRIGLGQVRIRMGDKKANVAALLGAIEEAAAAGCDVAVLPECSLAGWLSASAGEAAEAIPGPFTKKLQELAKRHRMAIAAGLEERDGDLVYNSAVMIGRDGKILGRHRKVNELEIGLKTYTRGSSLNVFDFEGRPTALSICADSWTPTVTDALYDLGARLIFSPSAWAVEPGGEATNIAWIKECYRLRAANRDLTIVAPNGVGDVTEGPWEGRILQGNSLVTGPNGKSLLTGPTNKPGLLTLSI
jgi:predicted amidohydrolase